MDQKKVIIDIAPITVIKVILLCAASLFLFKILDIIFIVLAAIVIASAIEPATLWFTNQRVRRVFAVAIIYLLLALIFLGIVSFFVPKLLHDFPSLLSNISSYISVNEIGTPDATLISGERVQTQGVQTLGEIVARVNAIFSDSSQGLIGSIRLIFGGLFHFILIIVLSFYLALKEDGISAFLRLITPAKYEEHIVDVWKRSQKKIGLWMQGQLLLGVLVGVLVYIGLRLFGIPHALLLALLAAVFEIVPIFGPIFAAIPAVLLATDLKGAVFGLTVAGLYFVIQQVESHIIYPLVVKKIIGISPIVVILALVIGAKLGGFFGILISVPISAVIMEYISDIWKDKKPELLFSGKIL